MAKKHEYIKKNLIVVRQLVKSGDISCKLINDFNIYQVYKSYNNITSKMDRYQFVARDLNINNVAVMRAVKSMESTMKEPR